MMDNQYLGAGFGPKKVLLWCLVIMSLAFAFGVVSYVSAYRDSVAYQSFGATGEGHVRFCFARERTELQGALDSMRTLFA